MGMNIIRPVDISAGYKSKPFRKHIIVVGIFKYTHEDHMNIDVSIINTAVSYRVRALISQYIADKPLRIDSPVDIYISTLQNTDTPEGLRHMLGDNIRYKVRGVKRWVIK